LNAATSTPDAAHAPAAEPGASPRRPRLRLPFRREHRAVLLGSAATVALVLLYWVLAPLFHPGEPSRVTLLYRFTDTDYLPAIYGLARGEFGEIIDPVTYGRGLLPFPALMLLPHALGVALFGDYGFALADAAVALAHFLLAWHIVRSFVAHRGAAAAGAFLLVVSLFPGEAWRFRYPRPFVSHLFLMAMVLVGARLWTRLRAGRPPGHAPLLLGLVAGAAAQGDFHAAVGYCLAVAALYGTLLYERGTVRMEDLKAVLWTGVGAALGIVPLLVHSRFASEELLARWGMYPASRDQTTIAVTTAVLLVFLLGVAALLLRLRTLRRDEPLAASEAGVLVAMLCLCFGALAAGPVSTWVLGKQIQVYHYQVRLGNTAQVALLVAGLALAWHVGRRYPRLLAAGALLASTAPLGLMLRSIVAQARVEHQARVFWNHAELPGYRADLSALLGELRKPAYRGRNVLGTFDQQLGMLWVLDRRHTLFVPDPFLSTVGDAVIEERSMALSRLMGRDAGQFLQQARDEYFQKKFLTLGKWQLSRSYAPAPLEDYDPADLRTAFATSPKDNWNVALPLSEQRRMLRAYDAPRPGGPAPDLVILSTVLPFAVRDPGAPYRLTFANRSFRVFVRG
jgi:hypothetical protein